ncbi:MAG: tyrosine-type recombinase/integrase [Armatimonadia bacterium]
MHNSPSTRLRLVTANSAGWPGWTEASDDFLQDLSIRQYSPYTINWYRSILSPFVRFLGDDGSKCLPSRVDEVLARGFIADISLHGASGRGPLGAKRQNDYRDGLHLFWRWLLEHDYATANPWEHVAKAREGRKIIATLTSTQIKALLDQPPIHLFVGLRDFCFMMLLLDTGLRLSETLSLQLPDLDLGQATVKALGKGNKERVVGISSRMLNELEAYRQNRAKALEGIGMGGSPWLFPNDIGGKLTPKAFQVRMRAYGDKAGISGVRVSPHTLRHTHAVNFIRSGGDAFYLQRILGHSSLEMTRRYCEVADEDAISRQRELSPLHTMDLPLSRQRRMKMIPEWKCS